MWCSTSKGGTLRKLHVSHFITMIMANVSHILCCFIHCFLEQVFQTTWVLSIEGWHQPNSTKSKYKKYIAVPTWPQMTFDLDMWPLTLWTHEGSHITSINQVWFQSDFNFSNEVNFTFSAYHTTWPQMTFDLGRWPLTAWTLEGSNITSINQVWFQSDFNFSNEANFTFSAYLIIWPQMTFDLGRWPLTSWTLEGSNITSINQVWFQSDFNFSNEANFTFSAYLIIWPQMTFDLDMWPLTSSTNEGSHVAPMTQVWLKSMKVCGR